MALNKKRKKPPMVNMSRHKHDKLFRKTCYEAAVNEYKSMLDVFSGLWQMALVDELNVRVEEPVALSINSCVQLRLAKYIEDYLAGEFTRQDLRGYNVDIVNLAKSMFDKEES